MINRSGRFEVYGEVAVKEAKSEFQIHLRDQKLSSSVTSTGGYDQFTVVKLGELTVADSSEHTIQIRPVGKKWQPINLRSLTLKAID